MIRSNRTVLITGGTNGIGLGLAEAFQKSKSRVIVCGRDKAKLSAVKEKFTDIITLPCDVSVARQDEKLAEAVISGFPDLDILVNNAGIRIYRSEKRQ